MSVNLLFLCAVAAFLQTIKAQCIGRGINGIYRNPVSALPIENGCTLYEPANINGIYGPASPLAYGCASIYTPANTFAYETIVNDNVLSLAKLSASNCGSFGVRSSSPFPVNGVFVESQKILIEGPLVVNGQLPFLGTVGLEGALAALGNGGVAYKCDSGNIGILNEEYPSLATLTHGLSAPGYVASGYGSVAPGYDPVALGYSSCGVGPYGRPFY